MAPRELNITQVEKLLNNLNSSPHQWGLVLENLEPLPSLWYLAAQSIGTLDGFLLRSRNL